MKTKLNNLQKKNIFSKLITKAIYLAVLISFFSAPSFAQANTKNFEISLTPLEESKKDFPFFSAMLAIKNNSKKTVESVQIRLAEGGPTFIYPVTVFPDDADKITVKLPIFSKTQIYSVQLFTTENPDQDSKLSSQKISMTVPDTVEVYNYKFAIIDSLIYTSAPPDRGWSISSMQKLFLFPIVLLITFLCAMFIEDPIKRTGVRIFAILLVSIIAIAVFTASEKPFNLQRVEDGYIVNSNRFAILEISPTLNLGQAYLADSNPIYHLDEKVYPVYKSQRQLTEDQTKIYADGKIIFLITEPNSPQAFKKK